MEVLRALGVVVELEEQSERHDQELLNRQFRRQTMEQGGRRYVFLIGDEALRMARGEPDGAE